MSFVYCVLVQDVNSTVTYSCSSYPDALKVALNIILDQIQEEYISADVKNTPVNSYVKFLCKDIIEKIRCSDFSEAVYAWTSDSSQFSFINKKRIEIFHNTVRSSVTLNALPSDDFINGIVKKFNVTQSCNHNKDYSNIFGATCRNCKSYNDYANPDSDDNTYLCYSCKAFSLR